jgi:hypothetical protein
MKVELELHTFHHKILSTIITLGIEFQKYNANFAN